MFKMVVAGFDVSGCPNVQGTILCPDCKLTGRACRFYKNCDFKKASSKKLKSDKVNQLKQLILPYIPNDIKGLVINLIDSIGE